MTHSLAKAGLYLLAIGLIVFPLNSARADEGALKPGDHIAIVGDSITEQKIYSVFMEDYLLMCKPVPKLTTTQFGWSGETSWGFAARMGNDMIPFGASVATTCFGMNDGGYGPESAEKAKRYHDAQMSVVEQMKQAGVRFIVVGSPGCVDSETFKINRQTAEMYNGTLAAERDIARQVAQEQGVGFADVFTPMYDVMTKAKAKYGNQYDVAGPDGVHPRPNGHLVMAYAFLKGLGCDGNVGSFTLNLAENKAQASEGHEIIWAGNGRMVIESNRYPFCFTGDPKSPNSTAGIIEFLPFNQELNRFMLTVSDAKADQQYKVTWGGASKTFSGAALAKGINLAAEFVDDNPFREPFRKVEEQIRHQQNFETPLVKESIHGLLDCFRSAPEELKLLEGVRSVLVASDVPIRERSALAVTPVRHTIVVEEVK